MSVENLPLKNDSENAASSAGASSLAARVRRVEIKTRRVVNDMMVGAYHSQFKGRGMDFEELREYIPGDDVRSIDWNVTARIRRPFVKNYREERELTTYLVVDVSGSGDFGSGHVTKREFAAEVAATLAVSVIGGRRERPRIAARARIVRKASGNRSRPVHAALLSTCPFFDEKP